MSFERYNARAAENRWQGVWRAENVFAARDDDPRPRYALNLSGCVPLDRLGHVRSCTMGDVVARYKRANGFIVLYARDAFGVPAKKATATGWTGNNAGTTDHLTPMGLSFDCGAPVTCDPAHDRPRQAAGFEVDLDDIIDTYGADAVRWFLLSDSPPDQNVTWNENGIHGAWRFVHRLWRLINNAEKFSRGAPSARPASFSGPALEVRKTAHRALARVSGNLERIRFNVCVAHIYAFARTLEGVVTDSPEPASVELKFAAREAAEILVQLFHPMMPHLAEECWAAMGHATLLAGQGWPALDTDLLLEDAVTLQVHVNGRRRADVTVARDARNGDIEASVLALDVIRRALDGKTPRKVIIVPQRIINVVA